MKKQTDIFKLWAVVWNPKSMEEYGIESKAEQILYVDCGESIPVNVGGKMGRPKIRYADALAIFHERKEADAFRKGNEDFVVIPCELETKLPE